MGFYIRGRRIFSRLAKWALRPFRYKVVILLYHRVSEAYSDPQMLCVNPENFAAHLEYIRGNFKIICLDDLLRMIKNRTPPKENTVAVTFDDGYSDNLYNARPLLERFDIPATVFVSTGYLGENRRFWWDELEKLLLYPGILPQILKLNINGSSYMWDLGTAANYTRELYERHKDWDVMQKQDPTPRHYVYRSLCQTLLFLPAQTQIEVLERLSQARDKIEEVFMSQRPLSHEELIRLHQCSLIKIGSHTVTHPALSLYDGVLQEKEIFQSKAELEETLCEPVMSFSYPYHKPFNFTRDTVDAVRRAGFTSACSAHQSIIWHMTDPFRLPRLLIRDYNADTFAAHLERGFYG